ncbi:MAG: hypothetical protein MJ161_01055 [Clostridia bacterium]|nr:hypothetical protein [Clostridia bacterium]
MKMKIGEMFRANIFTLAGKAKQKKEKYQPMVEEEMKLLADRVVDVADKAVDAADRAKHTAMERGEIVKQDLEDDFVVLSKKALKKMEKLDRKAMALEKKLRRIEKKRERHMKKYGL